MLMRLLPFLALGLVLAGCIEFERQTLTYQHDAASDTLRIHQTYHGIFGAEDPQQLTDKEREQLASVMKGQRTFFFANWAFELNQELLLKQLADEVLPKTNSLEEAYRRATTNLLTLLIANVQVENGKFYLNEKGQACGTQRVTLRNVSKLLAAGNATMRKALELEMKDKQTANERELINQSLARPEPFFSLTGQQIRFRFPLTKAEFDKLMNDDAQLKRFFAEFVKQGGVMQQADGELHASFGRTDAQRETVTLPMTSRKTYAGNALQHLRDTYGLAKEFNAEKEAGDFLRPKPPAK